MSQELVIHSLQDIEKMATIACKSNLFGIIDVNKMMSLMLLCQAENIPAISAVRDYHIIDGKPALKADAMLARHQQSGGSVKWEKYEDDEVIGVFSHPKGGDVRIVWNMEMAKKTGQIKPGSGWVKYPRSMLKARCITEGIKAVNPGVNSGFYTPEEVECFDDKYQKKQYKDVTPVEREYMSSLSGDDSKPLDIMDTAKSLKLRNVLEFEIGLCQSMYELSIAKSNVLSNKDNLSESDYEAIKSKIYDKRDELESQVKDVSSFAEEIQPQ